MTRGEIIRHNGWQTIVSLDQTLHCLGGLLSSLLLACIRAPALPAVWADETLSSHCWRWHLYGIRSWPCRLVDTLFWWQKAHCRSAYESERDGRQLPPELRSL
ncbi:MAG TPA: pseudouridine synthase [Desulfovibrio piger]|uniref:Uncharacterized protein n=1 Tax=Desulfovibrio piger ATCC 29098 TaxID=411464 RepID=B6WS11_9BACT|nr:hypothetical protein [Desulfovibrio piger]EEB34169.1 hypothetical protein DESPIG_00856 [Desulfovibrio piger ATCC 29098]HCZ44563.1 pseudouridine synthase [Desulfovibrio piger]